MMTKGKLPLEGIRVADFTWVTAGPTATRCLGALGAEVIKVTSQQRLDPSARTPGQWMPKNVNKRCCTINIAEPEGLALARRLVTVSDVLIESYGYGAMQRHGLGYEDVRQLRPDIIYVSSSGLGRTGPEKDAAAYGTLIGCYTGWSSITGDEGAEPAPHAWADEVVGITLAYTILACLYRREEAGMGQYVDFSMAEGTTALIPEPLMDYAMNGRVQSAKGNKDEFMAPHSAYKCNGQDDWVAVAVASDSQWEGLCRVMGRPDLAKSPSYATHLGRWLGRETLDKEVGAWTRLHASGEVVELLQAVGVPAGASAQAGKLPQDPYLQARGFIQWVQHDGALHPVAGMPWPAAGGPAWRFSPAPSVGEANDYVAGELLGLSEAEIESLVERKVLW